jgi:hypothetical protein
MPITNIPNIRKVRMKEAPGAPTPVQDAAAIKRAIQLAKLQRERERIEQDKRRWQELRHLVGRRTALNAAGLSTRLWRHGHKFEAVTKFADALGKGFVSIGEMSKETGISVEEIEACLKVRADNSCVPGLLIGGLLGDDYSAD